MNLYKNIKKRVYEIIGPSRKGDKASIAFDIVYCFLVLISLVLIFIEIINLPKENEEIMVMIEYGIVIFFSIEYLLQLWVSEYTFPEAKNKFHSMIEFIVSFDSLIDLIAIFSIFMNYLPTEFAMLKLIRLVKIVKFVKLSSAFEGLKPKENSFINRLQNKIYLVTENKNDNRIFRIIFKIIGLLMIFVLVVLSIFNAFYNIEILSLILKIYAYIMGFFFILEYIIRTWITSLKYPLLEQDKAKMKYIYSWLSLIDLLSIISIFIVDLPLSIEVIKYLYLIRIISLFKIFHFVKKEK